MNIADHLNHAARRIAESSRGSELARLEAELLLCKALDVGRSFIFAHPEQPVPANRAAAFKRLIQRRAAGEPIAYLTGEREFWSLVLRITPDVLIPRAETELLVEAALDKCPRSATRRVADLGTGSGAVALAIGSERPEAEIHATDTSEAALNVARGNAGRLGISNVTFHRGSWCAPLREHFDLIVSNPPYVASGDPHLSKGDCRFEPASALVAGPSGLEAIREIVGQAPDRLKPGGWLIFEHGFDQGPAARAVLMEHGFPEPETIQDVEARDRVTLGQIQTG